MDEFVEIPLAPAANPCAHGVRCADERYVTLIPSTASENFRSIHVRDVACSESAVYVIDEDSRVWSYGFGRVSRNARGHVEVAPIAFDRPVKKILAGRYA